MNDDNVEDGPKNDKIELDKSLRLDKFDLGGILGEGNADEAFE